MSQSFARPKADSAYEKYKASLHAMFDGRTAMPDNIRSLSKVEPSRISNRRISSAPAKPYDIFIEAIKRSTTPDEITRTIDALAEAGHELPEDEDILSKALSHRNDDTVWQILSKLQGLLSSKPSKSPKLLKTRLENTALLTSSSQIRELCQSLRSNITN